MPRKSSRSLWTAKLSGKPIPEPKARPASPGTQDILARREAFNGVVLGIDPSLRGTGLALVVFKPGEPAKILDSMTVKNKASLSFAACLGEIARQVTSMLDKAPVASVALEQTIYVQNFQTAQILGAARGAAITPAAMRGLPVFEYAPKRIKQAATGNGRASKEQVAAMVKAMLGLPEPLPLDEADAAATAICHAANWRAET